MITRVYAKQLLDIFKITNDIQILVENARRRITHNKIFKVDIVYHGSCRVFSLSPFVGEPKM